jgi:hypothetical protein
MRRILWFAGGLLIITVLVLVVGLLLPVRHTAAVRIVLDQPVDRVFDLIADVPRATAWRSDLTSVEILSGGGDALRWRETSGFGALIMAREESLRPTRLVSRIDDPDQPFGGRWIFELEPTGAGTALTITEEGEVYSPLFRFMSRFVFGHYRTLETCASDLARHFGDASHPVRVSHAGRAGS